MDRHEVIKSLRKLLGAGNVLDRQVDLQVYEYDAGVDMARPAAVCFPGDTQEVAAVVKLANRAGMPFVARGAGTNLSGGTIVEDGIVIEMLRMNRILEIDEANMRAVVQPGVVNLALVEEAARHGLLFAPDPASQKVSTLGGNVGENSGGPHCLKYGVTTNHILGLEVVLPDGEVVEFGGKALDVPGYDLTGVFVGSEGTFGIATKITVRLMPPPETVRTMLAIFETLEDAGDSVSEIIATGIIPATLEMMDKLIVQAIERSMKCGFPMDAEAVLIIELDGLRDGMDRLTEQVREICRKHNVREVKVAKTDAERDQLWAGRRGAFGALALLSPNYLVLDGTVPRTKLPQVLRKTLEIAAKYGLQVSNVFHAGDGNLHPCLLYDERNKEQKRATKLAGKEILEACRAAGGTITGEHGVGEEKRYAMPMIFSQDDMDAMRRLKLAFDPENLCNPNKVFPADFAVQSRSA